MNYLPVLLLALLSIKLLTLTTFLGAKQFRVALLYPKASADDMRCALEATTKLLQKSGIAIELNSYSYGADLTGIKDSAELIATEHYDAVIGPLLSHEALVTAPIFSKAKTTQFLPIASHPDLIKKFPNSVRMLSSASHYATLAAKFVMSKSRNSGVVIVANESLPYSTTYRDVFSQQLRELGFLGKISVYNFMAGKFNSSTVNALISKSPGRIIYAPIYAQDLVYLYRGLGDIKTPNSTDRFTIFTHAGLFDAKKTLAKEFNPKIEVFFNGIWDLQSRGKNSHLFWQAIRSSCAVSEVKPWTIAAWDALELARRTHTKHPTFSGEHLAEAARRTSFTGDLGQWKLDKNLEPIRSLPVFRFERSRLTLETIVRPTDNTTWSDAQ